MVKANQLFARLAGELTHRLSDLENRRANVQQTMSIHQIDGEIFAIRDLLSSLNVLEGCTDEQAFFLLKKDYVPVWRRRVESWSRAAGRSRWPSFVATTEGAMQALKTALTYAEQLLQEAARVS